MIYLLSLLPTAPQSSILLPLLTRTSPPVVNADRCPSGTARPVYCGILAAQWAVPPETADRQLLESGKRPDTYPCPTLLPWYAISMETLEIFFDYV